MAARTLKSAVLLVFVVGSLSQSLPYTLISNVFSSNMVLQREPLRANIWGWTSAGQSVTVVLDGPTPQTLTTTAAAGTGKWMVQLNATPAGGPYNLTVTSGSSSQTLTNVLFGDVLYCSGQSNMFYGMQYLFNATDEINLWPLYPHIRIFFIPNIAPTEPFDITKPNEVLNMSSATYNWQLPSSRLVSTFSAMCWLTGRHLADSMNNKVPIGLISNAWGGTNINQWISGEAANNAECNVTLTGRDPVHQSQLYNTLVYPLFPLQFIAMYWYQGEADVGYTDYGCRMYHMVTQYRQGFQRDFQFMPFQLAPRNVSLDVVAITRSQQHLGGQRLGNSCTVSNIDLGDMGDPTGPHPRTKAPLGWRAHLCTRKMYYKESNLVFSGPLPKCTIADPTANTLTIQFYKGTVGTGLELRTATCPDFGTPAALMCRNEFDINNGTNWFKANYALSADKQSLVLSGVTLPSNLSKIQYRNGWGSWPLSVLYNSDNLPPPGFIAAYQPDCSVPEIYDDLSSPSTSSPSSTSMTPSGQSSPSSPNSTPSAPSAQSTPQSDLTSGAMVSTSGVIGVCLAALAL